MAGHRAATRYAKSLISLSQEKDQLDAVYADMQLIAGTISESRELDLLLKSPIVKGDKKDKALNKIFASQIGELSNRFISILTKKKREEILEDIAIEFIAQYKNVKGQVVASVTTAIPLDEATKEKILKLVSSHVEGKVELVESVNPEIIGGFVVRIGDKMIDASIAKKLNDLKKELLGSSSYTIKLN
ncbi:MAG TPA: ATP synthase F1 subunit delta [Flavobacteriales bacterium]|nr:ATP synthase F1 subunit delta [Crocinitomicaceae bacterium]HAE29657.1 ATP synthase F1 subunit delta [Flavobacteriales bacterium]|tara:strand:- start:1108 stop:1671 length:564 start_codon:yes stop_codon:yes gene_type:complete